MAVMIAEIKKNFPQKLARQTQLVKSPVMWSFKQQQYLKTLFLETRNDLQQIKKQMLNAFPNGKSYLRKKLIGRLAVLFNNGVRMLKLTRYSQQTMDRLSRIRTYCKRIKYMFSRKFSYQQLRQFHRIMNITPQVKVSEQQALKLAKFIQRIQYLYNNPAPADMRDKQLCLVENYKERRFINLYSDIQQRQKQKHPFSLSLIKPIPEFQPQEEKKTYELYLRYGAKWVQIRRQLLKYFPHCRKRIDSDRVHYKIISGIVIGMHKVRKILYPDQPEWNPTKLRVKWKQLFKLLRDQRKGQYTKIFIRMHVHNTIDVATSEKIMRNSLD